MDQAGSLVIEEFNRVIRGMPDDFALELAESLETNFQEIQDQIHARAFEREQELDDQARGEMP